MFSKNDIRAVRVQLSLPYEKEKNLIEEFIRKFPPKQLERSKSFESMVIKLRDVLGQLPHFLFTSAGVSLRVSNSEMVLQLGGVVEELDEGEFRIAAAEGEAEGEAEEEAEEAEVWKSEKSLEMISDDFNFLLAGVFGILGVEELEAELMLASSKDTESVLSLDNYLLPDFWGETEGLAERHVSGVQVDFDRPFGEADSHFRLRLELDPEKEWKHLSSKVFIRGKVQGSIVLASIIEEMLDTANLFCQSL